MSLAKADRVDLRSIAIIVTYNPELDTLARLVERCAPQVDAVLIVDNGNDASLAAWQRQRTDDKVTVLLLGENLGIAAAQNAGILWARQHDAQQVILFDHDSEPPIDLVTRLQRVLAELEGRGEKIAAVGPHYVDRRWLNKTRSPFSRFVRGRMVGCLPSPGSSYVPVDFLIASGCLITIKALDEIGGMNEDLFIDYVDIEWGLRARSAGWALYGIWDIVMDHGLGDDRVVVLGRSIPIHSPLRHYYAIRNAVWLAVHSRLEGKWRWGIFCNGLRRFIAYAFFMPRRLTHIRYMLLGIWHALYGRMGRL